MLTTPFDFPMFQAMVDVVAHGESAKKIVTVLRQDRFYPHPELLVTLLDNHDRPRFITEAGGSREKMKLGLSLLATLRGIPQTVCRRRDRNTGRRMIPITGTTFRADFPATATNAFTQAGRTPEQQDVVRAHAGAAEASAATSGFADR